jgi:micrococcal nuclease
MQIYRIIPVFLGVLFTIPVLAKTLSATVIDIHDGDTMAVVLTSNGDAQTGKVIKRDRIRMFGLDTPEVDFSGQSQGDLAFVARDRLKELVPVGATINIEVGKDGIDRHGRILGRVIYKGEDINKLMLSEGMGVVYFINPREKSVVAEYIEASEQAEINKLGIFSSILNGSLAVPYDFRLQVNDREGTNLVGDFKTKRLYGQGDTHRVPISRRVFFSDSSIAASMGYTH